jgi:membrane peptidoglycan carboxypeptidase
MRRILLILVIAALVAGLAGPIAYLAYAADLPPLNGPEEIRTALAHRVESERMAMTSHLHANKVERFEILGRDALPKALVGALLAMEACPEYLEAPKEQGLARGKRILGRLLHDVTGGEPGPGRCQFRFADLIGETVGAADPIHAAIADLRILEALTVEQLVIFRLAATYYAPGVIGTRDASRALFGVEPARLDIGQTAELIAAESHFPRFAECKNPGKLRLLRDAVLDRMVGFGVITEAEGKRAAAKNATCARRP